MADFNDDPINQACAVHLRSVQRAPDPTYLYWVQLCAWAIDTRAVRPSQAASADLRPLLEQLPGWNPEYAMRILAPERDDEIYPELKNLTGRTPVEVAHSLLEILWTAHKQAVPQY